LNDKESNILGQIKKGSIRQNAVEPLSEFEKKTESYKLDYACRNSTVKNVILLLRDVFVILQP